MSIEIDYRSYKIAFREDMETWSCYELNIEETATLKQVKDAIDRINAKDRRIDLPALWVRGGSGRFSDEPLVVPVTVTILCEPKKRRYSGISDDCWIKDAKGERHKVRTDQVYPVDMLADLRGWLQMEREVRAMQEKSTEFVNRLKPYNTDTLALAAREAKVPA